jgi:biotin carboxyl carrier protein
MAARWTGGAAAVKYEVTTDGRAAVLTLENVRFRYELESGESIEQEYSLLEAGRGTYSVLIDGRSYTATLLSGGEVSVNGRVFRVEVFDPRSMRGRRRAGETEGRQSVAAPMPGRVIRVLVEVGQEVEAEQGLIVVEAMKMQNEMKSPKSGRVAEVKTAAGATVAAGEVLVVIE